MDQPEQALHQKERLLVRSPPLGYRQRAFTKDVSSHGSAHLGTEVFPSELSHGLQIKDDDVKKRGERVPNGARTGQS